MNTENTQKKETISPNYNFDLSTRLIEQNATRFTKTPPYVLFENVMKSLMGKMNNMPANSNNRWSK